MDRFSLVSNYGKYINTNCTLVLTSIVNRYGTNA